MIITINGAAGSGKSTIAKMLAEKLGWPRYCIGGIRRQRAKEKGMTLAEYNKLGETDFATDSEFDQYQKKLGKTKNNFIIEGRTSWHFIPHSIKIYFEADERERAQRVFNELKKSNKRNEDKGLKTLNDVLISHRRRKQSDIKRYKKYYNIDVYNKNHYDYVIDTTNLNKKQVFVKVYKYIKSRLNQVDKL
ncbi:MAG: cytidylate kinase family protein [Patescibacteria group bacterium]|nr:cytidylate kinase family protein [Patescibacteria group bacterium]